MGSMAAIRRDVSKTVNTEWKHRNQFFFCSKHLERKTVRLFDASYKNDSLRYKNKVIGMAQWMNRNRGKKEKKCSSFKSGRNFKIETKWQKHADGKREIENESEREMCTHTK